MNIYKIYNYKNFIKTCTRRASRASSYNTLGGQARGMRCRTASAELGLEDQ